MSRRRKGAAARAVYERAAQLAVAVAAAADLLEPADDE